MTVAQTMIAIEHTRPSLGDRLTILARTIPGRLLLVAAFTSLLCGMQEPLRWPIGICLLGTSLLPKYRRVIILLATLAWTAIRPPLDVNTLTGLAADHTATAWVNCWPVGVAGVWLFAWAMLWLTWRFPKSAILRRPVSCLLAALVAAIALARLPLTGLAWVVACSFALSLSWYIWFLAYWLMDNANRAKARPLTRSGFWRPFWGSSSCVPFGKGGSYLDRCEARDAEQLATFQIKGLRLLIWAGVIGAALVLVNRYLHGATSEWKSVQNETGPGALLPTYWTALQAQAAGHPYPWAIRWLSLILFFLAHMLNLCLWGHTIVACCRMAGFNIFRNTYRPLTATTIAEGYNRIYWYFKELLVTFFFYPTFLRHFKRWPRVRIFVATLAAAGLGNFIYHYLRDSALILRVGWRQSLAYYGSFAAYALVLGTAIALSQLRSMARDARREPPLAGFSRVRAIASVIAFYLLIAVYLLPNGIFGLRDYGLYLVNLFRP